MIYLDITYSVYVFPLGVFILLAAKRLSIRNPMSIAESIKTKNNVTVRLLFD